ncbi:hypothetical protein Mboo_2330 [Methanoregula boonei 6A8]|uniref:Uncharacterized protein n=2 Tax=Methanoregula TaxID=395331 RepID=A7IAT3_METB6|nr:hypothetical protein Mboo_2330 [Methanoregula boonei 6A8]
MSHSYLVRYSVKTNFKLKTRVDFNFPICSMTIYDSIGPIEDKCRWLHCCKVDVIISSEKIESAIDDALVFFDAAIGLISLQLVTPTDVPIFEKAIEWDDGIHDREFIQNTVLPHNLGKVREFDPEKFGILFSKLNETEIPYRKKFPQRIERAIRWFRMGIFESDHFTKYTCYWLGLEILNPVIKEKYIENITNHSLRHYHRKEKPTELINLAGIKYLLMEIQGKSYNEWVEIKEIRDSIVHGNKSLELIKTIVTNYLSTLEESLLTGIYECIGLSKAEIYKLIRPGYPRPSKTETRLIATLINADKKSMDMTYLPELILQSSEQAQTDVPNGYEKTLTVRYTLKNSHGPCNVSGIMLVGSSDPEMKKRKFECSADVFKK